MAASSTEVALVGALEVRNDHSVSAGKPACEWDDVIEREALVGRACRRCQRRDRAARQASFRPK